MREGIESQIMNTAEEIDIYHWLNRTALELIGQGGLGHSFDTLKHGAPISEDPNAMRYLM